jgi:F-type H+-transporting ATPase subunit alpha
VEVLKQKRNSPVRVGCQVAIVYAVINGYLDSIPVDKVKEYEILLYEKLEHEYAHLLERLEGGFYEAEDVEELKKALGEMQR